MNKRHTLISLLVVLLCSTILVLFTDLELSLVRWINCGPLAPMDERQSSQCQPGERP